MDSYVWESDVFLDFWIWGFKQCPWGSFCPQLSALFVSPSLLCLVLGWVRGSNKSTANRVSFLKTCRKVLERTLCLPVAALHGGCSGGSGRRRGSLAVADVGAGEEEMPHGRNHHCPPSHARTRCHLLGLRDPSVAYLLGW